MKNLYIIMLLFTFWSCKTAKYQNVDYSRDNNIAEFNSFIKDFEKNYIYLQDKKQLWDCIKRAYSKKVGLISNERQHILYYGTLLHELYDNHIHLDVHISQSYRLTAPVYVRNKGGRTFITNVWQTQLKDTLPVNIIGAEIVTMNNQNFQDMIENFPTICQNKNDEKIGEWVANKIIAGKRNENRILQLRLKNDTLFTLDLDSLKLRSKKSVLTASIVPNQNIGIIRVNNSLGDRILVKEFKRVLLEMDSTQALIIDLRNTVDGGNTSVAEPIMGMFLNKKQPYQLYENHKKKYLGYIKPKNFLYDKPIYILINRWTGSMGEGIAIGLNSMGRATIIGTEMARLAGGMKTINFKNHDYGFQVSIEKTFDINANPREEFIPENFIEQTRTDKDEILHYTIESIKTAGNKGYK